MRGGARELFAMAVPHLAHYASVIRLAITAAVMMVLVAATPASAELRVTGQFGTPGTAEGSLNDPSGVAFTANQNLWIADTGNSRLQRFTLTGASVLPPIVGFGLPMGLSVGNDDAVYVADPTRHAVVRLLADGTPDPTFRGDGFTDPRAVGVDPDGRFIYVVEGATGRVVRAVADSGAIDAPTFMTNLRAPTGIAIDRSGLIAVSERGAGVVRLRRPDGAQSSIGGPGNALGLLSAPAGVTFDQFGLVVVADRGNGRIQRFTQTGGLVDFIDGVGAPTSVSADTDQVTFAATDAAADRVLLFEDRLPPPRLGETVNAAPVSDPVTLRARGGMFRPLERPTQVRVGTEFDTSDGIVRILTAKRGGGTQPATLSKGRFILRQPGAKPIATLSADVFDSCPTNARAPRGLSAQAARLPDKRKPPRGARKRRLVRTKVKGDFRTVGKSATADVQGTDFEVADYCAGTLVTVFEGVVRVRRIGSSNFRDVRARPGVPGRLFVSAMR